MKTFNRKDALEKLFLKYKGPLYLYALKITGEPATSEDIVQEVFCKMIKYIDSINYEDEREIKAYLFAVARSCTMDIFRKNKESGYVTNSMCENVTYIGDCSNGDFPVLIGGREGGWVPIIEPFTENDILARNDSLIIPYEILVFPILGNVSSLSDIDIDNRIEVYPNPSSKEININSQFIINSIEILNSLGQKVYSEKINALNKTIDISALNKGIYIIELKTEKGVIHRKFIKE